MGQERDELRRAVEQAAEKAMRKWDEWQRMRPEERMAGALLADILGADWSDVEPRDLGGERVHDFDLVLHDGRRIAVEVTVDASPADRAFFSALAETFPLEASLLQSSWSIGADPPGDDADDDKKARRHCSRMAEELPAILEEAERLDAVAEIAFVGSYSRAVDTSPVRGLKDRLRALGVTRAEPVPAPGDGAKISVDQGPFAGWFGADSISEAVERHLWQRDDNYEKLIQAKTGEGRRADEAHLLIWVPCGEPHRNGAHAAARSSMIELGDIPKPDLKGVDAVWVAILGESNSKAGRPLLPVLRLGTRGWSRYECVWQRSKPDTGP